MGLLDPMNGPWRERLLSLLLALRQIQPAAERPLKSMQRFTRPTRNCSLAHERMCDWVLPSTCAAVTLNWFRVAAVAPSCAVRHF